MTELETPRLKLRQWIDSDFKSFAAINADPQVMAYYPSTLNRQQSDALAQRFQSLIACNGWGFWAVEEKASGQFIGFVGLNEPSYELPASPCVEIGWRLAKSYWGKGLATEAALECLKFAFTELKLTEVYSFTSKINSLSEAVMKRIGMENTGCDFNHPMLPKGHALEAHLLYKVSAQKM